MLKILEKYSRLILLLVCMVIICGCKDEKKEVTQVYRSRTGSQNDRDRKADTDRRETVTKTESGGKATAVKPSSGETTTKETAKERSERLRREVAERREAAKKAAAEKRILQKRIENPPPIEEVKVGGDPLLQQIKKIALFCKIYTNLAPHEKTPEMLDLPNEQKKLIDTLNETQHTIWLGHPRNSFRVTFDELKKFYTLSSARDEMAILRSTRYQWIESIDGPLMDTATDWKVREIHFKREQNDKIAKLMELFKAKTDPRYYPMMLQVKAKPRVYVSRSLAIRRILLLEAEIVGEPVFPDAKGAGKEDPTAMAPPVAGKEPEIKIAKAKDAKVPAPGPVVRDVAKPAFKNTTSTTKGPTIDATWETPGWHVHQLPANHPMAKACCMTIILKDQQVVAGVQFGAAAKTKEDDSFKTFEADQVGIFKQAMNQSGKLQTNNTTRHTIGGIEYNRMIVTQSGKLATICVGIQDGRAVAYWYIGSPDFFARFQLITGKAKPVER